MKRKSVGDLLICGSADRKRRCFSCLIVGGSMNGAAKNILAPERGDKGKDEKNNAGSFLQKVNLTRGRHLFFLRVQSSPGASG